MEHITSQNTRQDDEIDLAELFASLWEGKLIIALVSLSFFLVALAYSLFATETWEARATISEPMLSQFEELQSQVNNLAPVFNEISDEEVVTSEEKLNDLALPEKLLMRFIQQFNNRENKKRYLDSNISFKKQLEALEKTEDHELNKVRVQKVYHAWYEKLSIKKLPKAKGEDLLLDNYEIVAVAESSQNSYDLLVGYIEFIHAKSHSVILKDLRSLVDGQRSKILQQINILKEQAKSQLLVEKLKSEYELIISKSAGISRPLENYGEPNDDVFSISLGADALEAKVKVLESLRNLSLFEPMISQNEAKLSLLDSLAKSSNIRFNVIQFPEPAEKPYEKSGPNIKLIAIIGAILGACLGVVLVIVSAAFRKRETARLN